MNVIQSQIGVKMPNGSDSSVSQFGNDLPDVPKSSVEPPISRALDELNRAIERWGLLVDRMERKLSPVMGPERPIPTDPRDSDVPQCSTITGILFDKVSAITHLSDAVEGYLNRLEI